jgi:cell division protein FtsQ
VKYNWKKILSRTLWVLAGAGTVVLFGAAMVKKSQRKVADVHIEITGAEKHMFIDEKDVLDLLNRGGRMEGTQLAAVNLRALETQVEKNPWVRNAEMFLDNTNALQVRIEERQPVARIFTMSGNSFYLDSAGLRLPLSDKISARVPMFTGYPSDRPVLSHPDSVLLQNIVKLGQYIVADSFWMAQVAQVAITPQAGFELVPVLGDHVVALGDAEELDGKFKRLYAFYKKAWLQHGINAYEKIDVQYDNQVVAVRRGTAKAMGDSVRAKEIMNAMHVAGESQATTVSLIAPPEKPVVDSISGKAKVVASEPAPATAGTKKSVGTHNNKT